MSAAFSVIETKVAALVQQGRDLLRDLDSLGWDYERPDRIEAVRVKSDRMMDELLSGETEIPASARIPHGFVTAYHQWYSSCLALVEVNMRSRREELAALHHGVRTSTSTKAGLTNLVGKQYMTFSDQIEIERRICEGMAIVASIPQYLEGRLHDLELAVAQAYVGDQLTEAGLLVKAGHTRAAGAVAGVLLERHLKLLCDHQQPPIKYPKRPGISKLNDLLKEAAAYDQTAWRKVQWMGDVRNDCDHPGPEPRREDLQDLIAEVRKFVALFTF